MRYVLLLQLYLLCGFAHAQMDQDILKDAESIESKVIDWRHYFHQNPELSNREFNTAKKLKRT